MKKAIQLVETREGCAMMESTPRYNVMLNGVKVGQLYFNMTGYVGVLPIPSDSAKCGYAVLQFPERAISAFKKEAAKLNKEWETYTAYLDLHKQQAIQRANESGLEYAVVPVYNYSLATSSKYSVMPLSAFNLEDQARAIFVAQPCP